MKTKHTRHKSKDPAIVWFDRISVFKEPTFKTTDIIDDLSQWWVELPNKTLIGEYSTKVTISADIHDTVCDHAVGYCVDGTFGESKH